MWNVRHYVSTGDLKGFYTLRVRYNELVYGAQDEHGNVESYPVERDYFVQNLSTDKQRAFAKIKEMELVVENPDFDLVKFGRRSHEQVVEAARRFQGGKYEGRLAVEVFGEDPDYCVWFIRNRAGEQRDKYTVEHLLADDRIREEIAARKEAAQRAAKVEAAATKKCKRYLKSLIDTLESEAAIQVGDWNHSWAEFITNVMVGNLSNGIAPRGRLWDMIADTVAKYNSGYARRGSKAYEAAYDEAMDRLESAPWVEGGVDE